MSRTTLSAACIAALAAPLLITAPATAQVPDARPTAGSAQAADETELRQIVAEAATAAADRRHDTAYLPQDDHGARPGLPAIDEGMATIVADGALGVAARVQTPTLVWQGADGQRRLGEDSPAGAQDRFRVASITKTMVATLVLQEVQDGTWTLDTLVEEVLPGTFPEHPDVTIGHLLSHTSGAPLGTDVLIASRMADPSSWEEFLEVIGQDFSDAEHVAAANALLWSHGPGEGWTYSNPGYVVLGMMLEQATGESVGDLLAERVFAPAGMTNTSYPDDPGTPHPFLVDTAYTGEPDQPWHDLAHFDPDVFSHAGAAVSTTGDLNRFTDALISGDLLDPETVEQMLVPVADEELGYGLGIYRIPDPCADQAEDQWLYGHDGASFGTISLAFTSADGQRQFSIGVTGRDLTEEQDALYDLNDVLVPLLLATC